MLGRVATRVVGLVAVALVVGAGELRAQQAVVTGTLQNTPAVAADSTYKLGEQIWVSVLWSRNVEVGLLRAPNIKLRIQIGDKTRLADYSSGHNTQRLDFVYRVQASDLDADGYSVAADALTEAPGGVPSNQPRPNKDLGTHAITNAAAHKVNGSLGPPGVIGVALNTPQGSTYVPGDTIEATLTFTKAVDVDVTGGTPQLALNIGSNTRQAPYVSGTGTTEVVFRYEVASGDADGDGISIGNTALGLNGGTIQETGGTTNAVLTLRDRAVSNSPSHTVGAHRVHVVDFSLNAPLVGDTYERDDTIVATVTFGTAVDVTGTPYVGLGIGANTRQAEFATGSGTTTLEFRYLVTQGDGDGDGMSVSASALTLNSGTIVEMGGTQNATLSLSNWAFTNNADYKVVGSRTAPVVSEVAFASSPGSGGDTYAFRDTIEVAVTWNRVVRVNSGTPQLALTIGTETRQANYVSGHETPSLKFQYVVQTDDADTDGISIGASALGLNGGEIDDWRSGSLAAMLGLGAANAITNDGDHKVNGRLGPPGVLAVSLNTPPGGGDTYGRDDAIEATVQFTQAVDVDVTGGTPQVALTIGSATRQANYVSGSGTADLTFRYVVVSTDADADGISIGASALGLNGGEIDVAGGMVDAVLDLGANAIANSTNHKVAGTTLTPPTVDSVWISTSPSSGDTYGAGERVDVTARFFRPVMVDETGGTPQLALTIGLQTRQAPYVSSLSTATELVFRYTVVSTDADTDGISVGASALALNGGTINDARDNTTAATLALSAIANDANHKVDGATATAPSVTSVAFVSSPVAGGDTYGAGEQVEVGVWFDIPVDVTGAPQLALTIGGTERQAPYSRGDTTAVLVFGYTLQSTDMDADGISVGATALTLNSGTIQSSFGGTATLSLSSHAISNADGHKVNGATTTVPAVNAVSIATSPVNGDTYRAGEDIRVDVDFNVPVEVTGVPLLAVEIGADTVQVAYAVGSGTTGLSFDYHVRVTDSDSDGISVGANALTLNGGTIRSTAAANAALGLGAHAVTNDAAHKVDGSQGPPGVTGLALNTPPVGGVYERGDTIVATVTFNKSVTVTGGPPRLILTIGVATRPAAYATGSGSTMLEFRYVVESSDEDADGFSVGETAIDLNSGTIQVTGGTDNALLGGLDHYTVSNYMRVSGSTFNASSVSGVTVTSSPADGSTYGLSEVIEVAVELIRPVDVDVTGGTPQLALGIGSATAQASYVSASSTADSLVFRHEVASGDQDADGISIGTGALTLNGGSIFDSRDGTTAAVLGLGSHAIANAPGQAVDGTRGPPGVVGVSLSTPVVGDTYERDDTVVVTVRFNKAVDVDVTGGTPQVALVIGSTTRQAVYASGTGTSELTFRYAVTSSDADADGISVGASALALNGGTIDVANGTVDALLSLGTHAITNSAAHKVVGSYTAPAVSGVRVTSTPPVAATYGRGERIEVEVTFNRPVDVTATPQLALILGTDTVQADYATGTGSRSLAFRYTVTATDADTDGISVGAGALTLSSGDAINDSRSATVAASLALGTHTITDDAAHKVDGTIAAASVTGVAVSSSPESGDTYGLGERIEVEVTFDRSVTVTGGAPQLALTIGGVARQATYASGSGTQTLAFAYWVQGAGSGGGGTSGVDGDTNGLSVGTSALTLNGATIVNTADGVREAGLALGSNTIVDDGDHKVDGTIEATPEVAGVTIASAPSGQQGYAAGSAILVRVSFSRTVEVTGTPRLALVIGSSRRLAAYSTGSGTPVLVFRYVVQPTDTDPDGFSVPANALELDGGSIEIFGGSATAALDLGSHAMDNVGDQAVAGGGATDPYFETPEYEFELTENVAGPVAVGVVLATDPYEGDVTYALGEGGEGLFEVAEWGGEVTYVGEGADAEERSEYVLEVVATAEDGRFGKALVRVKVLNVNEPPAYGDERLAFELAENVAGPVVLGVAAAVDRDEGDTLTYRLESGDADRFEVDAATAEVRYVGAGEDYDTDGPKSWELEVRATDKAGLSAQKTVAVVLRNENEAPVFADSTYAFEFAENVAGPLVLGTVRATDPDVRDRLSYALASGDATRFEVVAASGAVRYVGSGEDAEAGPGSWQLVVRVTDGGGLTADASVVVVLVDENEVPSFADASYEWEFEENVAGPLVLGTVRATDPDRADTLTYSLAGADAERFEIDAGTGAVRYVGSGEDAEAGPEGWEFEVMVVDGGGLTAKAPVTVVLLDVNEAPLFADSAYAFELPENASGPRELGQVEATDVDADDVLTYSITSGDAGRFEVDASSGVVRYVGGGEDYEAGPREYALMLRVMDTGGLTDEASAVVALLDVNEGPEAVGSMAPKVLEAYGAAVEEELGPYFLDPDGDALSYAAESSVAAVAVATVSSGRLSIAPQGIGVATVTVRATDPGGLEATQQVQVTVEASRSERTRALKLALAAFGRSLGAETVEAIGGRLGVESSGSLGRSHVQLGGRSLGCDAFGGGGAFGGGNVGAGEDGAGSGGGRASCGWEQLARGATGLLGLQLTGPAATGQGAGSGMPGSGGVATLDAMSLLFGDGSNGSGGTDAFGAGGGQYRGQQEPTEPGSMDLEQQRGGLTFNPVSGRQMRSQSSFQLSFGGASADTEGGSDMDANATNAGEFGDDGVLPSQAASRAGWTLWGQANAGEFHGTPDDGLSLEGRTRSAYVGLDYRFGSGLLLGLAGSRSAMDSDFDSKINGAGTVDARLTSLYPYLHWSPREGLGLWGLVGAGRGDADLAEVAGGQFSTDLDMRMGALGVRQELVGALALKADAFSVRIESADGGELAGVTAEAQRVRLAPELTGQWTMGGGGVSVRTRVELGGRYDGGNAETGLGAEAGAEFGFAHLGTGLSVDARGRTLLAHQEDQFREWGASFAVRLQPGRDRGGLSFSLEPSWGDAAGGAQALWRAQGGFGGQALGRDAATTTADAPGWTPDRMAMELGWGVVLPGGGEVKPFGRWSREGADGYRLNAGTRWTALGEQGDGEGEGRSRGLRLMIDFFGEQVAGGVRPTERRIGLLGQIGFK